MYTEIRFVDGKAVVFGVYGSPRFGGSGELVALRTFDRFLDAEPWMRSLTTDDILSIIEKQESQS